MASANGARLLAFYELIHAGDRAMLELPVVGLTDVLDGDPRRALVLNPETGQVHPFGEDIPWGGGTVLTAGYVRPAPTPVEAAPGWLAELWVVGSNEAYVGTFPVLAWEPRDRDDSEHAHGGGRRRVDHRRVRGRRAGPGLHATPAGPRALSPR